MSVRLELRRGLIAALALPVLLLAASSASALTDEEIFRSLRFDTPTPGARALGLGGAFIGLADDPSAMITNPAGIGFLSRPQLAVDFSISDPDEFALDRAGVFQGTWARGDGLLDPVGQTRPGFVGYVHPVTDRIVVGFSRYEQNVTERRLRNSYLSTAFGALEGSVPGIEREALGTDAELDMLVDTYNTSIAVAVHEQLSIGLTVGMARLDVTQRSTNYIGVPFDANGNGMDDTLLRAVDYETIIDDDDAVVTFSAGLLWKVHPKISIGLAYRDGAEFDLIETVGEDGARAKALRDYLASPLQDGRIVANLLGEFVNTIATPDSYGVGMSFGPFFEGRGGGGLIITADVSQAEYTDLLDNYVAGLNNQLFAGDSEDVIYEVDDETEWHLGLGYTWTVGYNNSAHLRVGVYEIPNHAITTTGRPTDVDDPFAGGKVRAGYDDGLASQVDDIHVTLGGGFTVKRGFYAFELAGAADFSDYGEQYIGSASFKF